MIIGSTPSTMPTPTTTLPPASNFDPYAANGHNSGNAVAASISSSTRSRVSIFPRLRCRTTYFLTAAPIGQRELLGDRIELAVSPRGS